MGYIAELFGGGKKTYELGKNYDFPEQISVKATPEQEDLPEDPYELERAYRKDSICFNAINKHVQMIMSAGYELTGEENSVKQFGDFFENVGDVGEDITFDEIFEAIYKYQMIYGNAFVELVFNKKMDRIVDLTLADPKRMDYAKTSDGKIALNKYGKPIGYILKLPWGVTAEGDKIPEEYKSKVSKDANQIFMLPERICHFRLYTVGDRFYGIGLIEPAYKSVVRKMNIEEAQTNSIYSRGTYPVIAYVGDPTHEPTPQDIDAVLKNLVKLKHDRYMAFQNWVKVEPLEVKQSDVVDQTLDYLRLNQTASLGMPMAFATGTGENTNRATLNNQQRFLEFTLNDIVKKTLSTFRKYILKRISFYNRIKEIPKIKWGDIGAEEINEKSERLARYIKSGALKPEDITRFIKKSEGLE